MTASKKLGRGRPKGKRTATSVLVLDFAKIAMVLENDNRNKAVRHAVDLIHAFNEDAPHHELELLPDEKLIPADDTATRRLAKNGSRAKAGGREGEFTLAGDDRRVGYLARQPELSFRKIPKAE